MGGSRGSGGAPFTRAPRILVLALGAVLATAAFAQAAPGDLDRSFGHRGFVSVDFGGFEGSSAETRVLGNGDIVLATITDGGYAVARLHPDGSFDRSFSGDGKTVIELPQAQSLDGLLVQRDGRIVVSGLLAAGGEPPVVMVRLKENGRPDKSFGLGGFQSLDFDGYQAPALAQQPDGKLVVAGRGFGVDGIDPLDFKVMRLKASGKVDSGFGNGGSTTLGFGGADAPAAVAIDRKHRIVVAGQGGVNEDMVAARLKPGGGIDRSFAPASHANGALYADFGGSDIASGLVLEPDGHLVLGGEQGADGPAPGFGFAGLKPNGSLDRSFGSQGLRRVAVPGALGGSDGVIAQPNGAIVAAGNQIGDPHFVFTRISPAGKVDRGFGTDGVARVKLPFRTFDASLGLQRGGKIIVAGADEGSGDLTVARIKGRKKHRHR